VRTGRGRRTAPLLAAPHGGPALASEGAAPEHAARLAGLGELALERLPPILDVRVVPLDVGPRARAEGQQEAVQVAAIAHQLRVVGWPAAILLS